MDKATDLSKCELNVGDLFKISGTLASYEYIIFI